MDIYTDPSRPARERARDLTGRLDLPQKIAQLSAYMPDGGMEPDLRAAIPLGAGSATPLNAADSPEQYARFHRRLQRYHLEETPFGIPVLIHNEAASGGMFRGATVFPSAIGQGSSWNPALVGEMAAFIRGQMLAVGYRHALSPVLDISRDPRWGRMNETYGEDATLIAAMASAFVRAMQDAEPHEAVAACAKHFLGHGVTEGGLNMAQTVTSERELLEVHAKPFQAAISEGGLMSVMNSYCMYNGEPVAASHYFLTELLRDEMGFDGAVVSDYVAINRLVEPFRTAETYTEAGIQALRAGLDVEYPLPNCYTGELEAAVQGGRLEEAVLDRAVERVLDLKFRLGLFEHPYPDYEARKGVFLPGADGGLNGRLARESVVLLKNRGGLLPLPQGIRRLAVVGPHADSVRSYFGSFSYPGRVDRLASRRAEGIDDYRENGVLVYRARQAHPGDIPQTPGCVERALREMYPGIRSLRQALDEALPGCEVVCARGVSAQGNEVSGWQHALRAAADADFVLLTLGGRNGWGQDCTVGEGLDAVDIGLPGEQERFAREVRALGRPTAVLHFDGRPLSSEFVASHFDAILEVWQPGEEGGQALADLLTGRCAPSGRLPVTAARNSGQLPVYHDLPRGSGFVGAGSQGMNETPLGYTDATAFPLYPFGHGLSYTEFAYGDLALSDDVIGPGDAVEIALTVRNTGGRPGQEVVQLYVSDPVCSMVRPAQQLAGFHKLFLEPGEAARVRFRLAASQLAFLDRAMRWKVEAGEIRVALGASSADIRLRGGFRIAADGWVDARRRRFCAEGSHAAE